ncbi:MAG: hypothetical protein R3C12_23890 [Planctomycetaceae bacterium]
MTEGKENETSSKSNQNNRPEIPQITHFQFLVLDLLARNSGSVPAQTLKNNIESFVPFYNGPKYYQLMKRMQIAGYVSSRSNCIEVAGSEVTRTFYSITPLGFSVRDKTISFYRELLSFELDI